MTRATRIAVMRAGMIEQYATPDVLYERPSTLFVAGFVGSPGKNFLSGSIMRGSAPVARIETEAIPLDGYPFCASPDDAGRSFSASVPSMRRRWRHLATACRGAARSRSSGGIPCRR
jgi:ABC-type proline/glycine betaine transport system ATPase subunit